MTDSGTAGASFVLGSGPSILDITDRQREWLSAQPFVFAMNKYLLFWEIAGIQPSHFFLLDSHFPAYAVLQESVEIAQSLDRPPLFCLRDTYRRYVNQHPIMQWMRKPGLLKQTKNEHGFVPEFLEIDNPLFFKSTDSLHAELKWADNLNQVLYYYRGSLTVLLNLITILNPNQPIYLLGVDMNTADSFYQDELNQRPMLRDQFHSVGEKAGKHPTVVERTLKGGKKMPGILDRWPFIKESCEARGCPIYNTNPNSMLVEEGLAEHRPLPEISDAER